MAINVRAPRFIAVFTLFGGALLGCGMSTARPEKADSREEAIVDVNHTEVERQSIGNCWIYAEASWAESMYKTATGADFDISQSYWTYWHWFGEITGSPWSTTIQTGGWWSTANDIVRNYGLMSEADFVPEDSATGVEMSARQKSALGAMNDALKTGGRLDTRAKREDAALVLEVLNDAWQLTPDVRTLLSGAFGAEGSETIARGRATLPAKITSAAVFPAAYALAPTEPSTVKTLDRAIREWREVRYPATAFSRRAMQIRLQRALHDRQPAILNWFVDFNALESEVGLPLSGSFTLAKLDNKPGRQGGHMVVFEDYEAKLASGDVLKAGVTLDPTKAADATKLSEALRTDTEVSFFRIKNSWGKNRTDRGFAPGFPGYHDLYMDYLNGPVKQCTETENLVPLAERGCDYDSTPLQSLIMPSGYLSTP